MFFFVINVWFEGMVVERRLFFKGPKQMAHIFKQDILFVAEKLKTDDDGDSSTSVYHFFKGRSLNDPVVVCLSVSE